MEIGSREKMFAHLALIAMTAIYALNYHASNLILQDISGYELTFLRVVFAALVFSVLDYFIPVKNNVKAIAREDIKWLLLAAFLMPLLSQLLFFEGLKLTEPINASIMRLSTPIAVIIISTAIFVFKRWKGELKKARLEKLSYSKLGGVLLAVYGAYYAISGSPDISALHLFNGDFLVLLSAIAFGAYTIVADRLMKKGYRVISILKWSFLLGAIILCLLVPLGIYSIKTIPLLIELNLGSLFWFSLFFLLVFATIVTFILNISALKVLSPTMVGTYTCLQPLVTVWIGLLLGQSIDSAIILSGVLVIVGVLTVSISDEDIKHLFSPANSIPFLLPNLPEKFSHRENIKEGEKNNLRREPLVRN